MTYKSFYEDMVTARNHDVSGTDPGNQSYLPFEGRVIDIDLGDHDII
jgi:hypothetical protein